MRRRRCGYGVDLTARPRQRVLYIETGCGWRDGPLPECARGLVDGERGEGT